MISFANKLNTLTSIAFPIQKPISLSVKTEHIFSPNSRGQPIIFAISSPESLYTPSSRRYKPLLPPFPPPVAVKVIP